MVTLYKAAVKYHNQNGDIDKSKTQSTFFFLIIVLGIHCNIYKSSCNILYLNSPPPSFSFIFLSQFLGSWTSLNRSHVSMSIATPSTSVSTGILLVALLCPHPSFYPPSPTSLLETTSLFSISIILSF
jgi:hypothetical protein